MVIRRFFAFIGLALAFTATLIASAASWVWDQFAPAFREFFPDTEGDTFALIGGEPLDPAIQQSLRHEAGMSRMSAARHI